MSGVRIGIPRVGLADLLTRDQRCQASNEIGFTHRAKSVARGSVTRRGRVGLVSRVVCGRHSLSAVGTVRVIGEAVWLDTSVGGVSCGGCAVVV